MSLEIPAVMSPVGVNKDIVQDGLNGFLAESTEEWVDKLSRLIDDAPLRRQLGKAGRKTVEERFSIYSQRDRYLKFFDELSSR
jgi:glycosyltransferase involved in cell wall biosynthesis